MIDFWRVLLALFSTVTGTSVAASHFPDASLAMKSTGQGPSAGPAEPADEALPARQVELSLAFNRLAQTPLFEIN